MKGGNPPIGEITISGTGNATLGILTASIMTDEDVLIESLPDMGDVNVLLEAIQKIGARMEGVDRHTVRTSTSDIKEVSMDGDYIRKIHTPYYFIDVLLGGYKSARVPFSGDCNIDSKPIGLHTRGFRALGAKVGIERGAVLAHAIDLVGSHTYPDKVSVGATTDIMVAAVLTEGQITIENVAKEPHVVDVTNFLNSMGVSIKGAGTDIIRIKGVRKLHGMEYSIIPGQIETGTFMCAAAVACGDIIIKNVTPKCMETISAKLIEIDCEMVEFDGAIRMVGKLRRGHTNINTLPYPGLLTNMQPQMTVTLALASGTSIVTESISEGRFKYADELVCMGSNIKVEGNVTVIDGVKGFAGVQVNTPDLRAGAAFVIAGLVAEGYTMTDGIGYIQREYEHFEEKLKVLDAMTESMDPEKKAQKFKLKTG